MFPKTPLTKILFLDIETVPQYATFDEVPELEKIYWEEKSSYKRKENNSAKDFYDHAGIWAEFGKIICISVGYFLNTKGSRQFRLKTFSGPEKELLLGFKNLLENYFSTQKHRLCAHNGKEFDFPYIARRMLIHNLKLPRLLALFDAKPWEVPHIDTLQLWRFGDFKNYTSLKLMAHVLGIPSPKDDIDGSQITSLYYEEKEIDQIIYYCENDVLTIAQIYLKLQNENLLGKDEVFILK